MAVDHYSTTEVPVPLTKIQQEVMHKVDEIRECGPGAKADFKRLCVARGITPGFWISEYTAAHLEVCNEVWRLWHTTEKFKVGDKVYVVPRTPTICPTCPRATVTEVGTDGWGYHLRAFERDVPSIFLFNMWDKDLEPRLGWAARPVPEELLLK